MRLTGAGLVLVPLAVLSVVFGLTILAAIASDQIMIVSPLPLLTAALLMYAATLVLLGWHGITNVRDLHVLGMLDPLTGLPNRRTLQENIADTSRGQDEVAIAIIDLDSFKLVNDHYGHAVGDQLMQRCAAMLREICGQEARCFRLGGMNLPQS